jgi:hypothetical protein
MKLQKLIYLPEARVEFDAEEVDALFEAARAHYDPLCRRQSEEGGLLYGMRNQVEYYPPAEMCLDIHKVDLLAKVAEQFELVFRKEIINGTISPGVARIPFELRQLFDKLNTEYRRLNP